MLSMLLLGIGLAGAVGGPYILLLAFLKPRTFMKPDLAKRQGVAAFLVGAVIMIMYFKLW